MLSDGSPAIEEEAVPCLDEELQLGVQAASDRMTLVFTTMYPAASICPAARNVAKMERVGTEVVPSSTTSSYHQKKKEKKRDGALRHGTGEEGRVEGCKSHIETLKITSLDLRGENSATHEPAITTPSNQPALKSLRIAFSPELGEYLVHLISNSLSPRPLPLTKFWSAHDHVISGLGLALFPFLAHLSMAGDGADLPRIAARAISTASGNCIETVVLVIEGDNLEDWPDEGFEQLDTVLSSPFTPALQNTEIRLDDLVNRLGGVGDKEYTLFWLSEALRERRGHNSAD
ncbi:hypothetical protein B0H17DRAFT_1148075 [Mycena rosella]|uniref:Uncharacterized protein n=1 Tax=Mycena rosella TaxID=1033263 RepID=A0AAD7CGX1_MYCRO|nr:hypothetical protein B0H17DRAFT_1148075 [Mycena rosella]